MAECIPATAFLTCLIFVPFIVAFSCYFVYKEGFFKQLKGKKILFFTAHPDDECMFFAPSILNLSSVSEVFLLCLTTGDYYGQGETRKKELQESCAVLGLSSDHVSIVQDRRLPDDPEVEWDLRLVQNLLQKHISTYDIDTVVTFDGYGISGHRNHIALYKSLNTLPNGPEGKGLHIPIYTLESVSLVRKYISFLDLPWSIFSSCLFLCSVQDYFKAQRAMATHYSQYVWFRRLYVVFSRYMVMNTLLRTQGSKPNRE
ncbi:N-acetylglucosaminyl-phosphatidylinositol de-N-acetylase isoform X2 [Nematostella vectensis]|uniref:N-acetylglucosaminyl-phosphatidylinositol de-N-acetylase isoform X2 n=1 Tax=Nematostella vectensis TaxID=45351 RepID=UPI002076FF12|nr:N-acetylglucosaminyl-phosphatidylinositol de-N-acetylase isoform X2 [Nematostella vectensis]